MNSYDPDEIDIDFSLYGKEDPMEMDIDFSSYRSPSALREAAVHGAKGLARGAIGSYGNVLDIAGLSPKGQAFGEKERRAHEFEILKKMEQPGYVPSYGELMSLSDEGFPSYRFPTSEDVESLMRQLGAPEEPETAAGRYASRIGEFVGAGSAFGAPAVVPSAIAGAAGQSLEEIGAPKWAQAAAEIATLLKTGKVKGGLNATNPEIKGKLADLKQMGFSDQDLTLAMNALKERGVVEKLAKETGHSNKIFEKSFSNMSERFNEQLAKAYPGLEEGLPAMKEAAGEIFDSVKTKARDLNVTDPRAFTDKISKVIEELHRTLANTPQEKEVIQLLGEAQKKALKGAPADYFIDFYQGLNQIGHWKNPKQREHVFSVVKNGIKDALREQGPKGKELAADFDTANKAWQKFKSAEDVTKFLSRAITENGVDFKRMSGLLEDPKSMNYLSKEIGSQQAENLKKIADAGKNTDKLKEKIKGGSFKKGLETAKQMEVLIGLATLDPSQIAKALGIAIGAEGVSRLATKFLTDPKYQSLSLKAIESINSNKVQAAKSLIDAFETKMKSDDIL